MENDPEDQSAPLNGGTNQGRKMPKVLHCLFEEHRHLTALVRVLVEKADQAEQLKAGDYYLLRDIVGYLHDYPDSVHHPTENLLFEKLVQREPSMEEAVEHLRRDHDAVSTETQVLLDLLDEVIDEPTDKRERTIRSACKAFVEHQQKHMHFENQELFPAAIESLSRSDWRDIESYFAAVEDPLFGQVVGRRHRMLYEYLMNPMNKASEKFNVSRVFSLERLIMTGEIAEKGVDAWCTRLKDLGEAVSEETRSSLAKTLKPESLASATGLPFRYTAFLGTSVLKCGSDLFGIWTATARDTVALYRKRS